MDTHSHTSHTQAGHGGHDHQAHAGSDGGAGMMHFFAILSHVFHVDKYLSDYRTRRLVPVSNTLIIGSVVALAAGVVMSILLPADARWVGLTVTIIMGVWLAVLLVGGVSIMYFMHSRRMMSRQLMLGSIDWQGTEQVLDVGCGSGMMLNGAAQKLTTGTAIGIDLWQQAISGRDTAVLMKNAQAEGVADKISYQEMDARHLTFKDQSFDVVVSSFALHHIGSRDDIQRAIAEMVRVLKSGGTLSIVDIGPMVQIAEHALLQADLEITRRAHTDFFHIVTARSA